MGLEAEPDAARGGKAWHPAVRAEFSLAARCCRYAFARGDRSTFLVPPEVDWPQFLEIARFHRIEGIAWRAISCAEAAVPTAVMDSLAQSAALIAADNLRAAAESRRLQALFAGAGIPLLFLKGLTLGELAYGTASIKAAVDIDLLIEGSALEAAAAVLGSSGYRLVFPAGPGSQRLLPAWHRDWKESVWSSGDGLLQLDLHTACTDNSRLLPGLGVHSPRQEVEIGSGISLPTFDREELIDYLAVHGASSAWFRLKWISDFAALIHDCGADDLERLFARAAGLGAGRAMGQALLVANTLFETLGSSIALRERLDNDRITRRLADVALRLLIRKPVEPTASMLGTLPIHYSQFLLLPGIAYKLSELCGQGRRISWRMRA